MTKVYGFLSRVCATAAVAVLSLGLLAATPQGALADDELQDEVAIGLFCGPGGFFLAPPECSGFCFIGSCKAYGIDNIRASDGTERYPGAGNVTVYYCDC
jgi:hypothetical protein